MVDLYKILGIPSSASSSQIKSAFKKLAVKYHPDKNQGNTAAEDKFKEINTAYQILSDPIKKSEYDRRKQSGHQAHTNSYQQPHEQPTGRQRDKYYQRKNGNYQAPPNYTYTPKPPAKPPMNGWEVAGWLGGGITLMTCFILGLAYFLGNYEAEQKLEEAKHEYYVNRNASKALKLISESLNRNDEYGEAYKYNAIILSAHNTTPTHVLYNFNQAVEHLDEADAEVLFGRAEVLIKLKRFDDAKKDLDAGLKLSPSNQHALLQKGDIELKQEQAYDLAIQTFDKVLAISKSNVPALLGKAIALHHMKKYTVSNSFLSKAMSYQPKKADIYHYMGLNQFKHAQDTVSACKLWFHANDLGFVESRYYILQHCDCLPWQ